MVLRSLLARGKYHVLHQATLQKHSPRCQHFFQRLVPNVRIQNFCTAGGNEDETGEHDKDEKAGDVKPKLSRKSIEALRKLKQEMEELDKKFDSYFTADYAAELTKKGFVDSDDDFADSSESERSDLEISGRSEDELSPGDYDDDEEEDEDAEGEDDGDGDDDDDDEDEDDFDDIDEGYDHSDG